MQVQMQVNPGDRWYAFCNREFPNMDDACEWFGIVRGSVFKTRLVPRHSDRWVSGKTLEERFWDNVSKSKRSRED
jgi:hypothetical protein